MKSSDTASPADLGSPAESITARATRERALAPFLEQLRADDVPTELAAENARVALDACEREALGRFRGERDRGRPWPRLVAEGVAFHAKCRLRFQQSEVGGPPPDPEEGADLVNDLIDEAATGIALLDELQRTIDSLIRSGQVKVAKPLTDVRNGVRQGLVTMRGLTGSQGFAKATSRSAELIFPEEAIPTRQADPTEEVGSTEAACPTLAASAEAAAPGEETAPTHDSPTPRREPVRFAKERPAARMVSRRTVETNRRPRVLLGLLVVSLAAWGVLALGRTSYVPPPPLTLDDFRPIPAVVAVTARAPSAFVELRTASWTALPEEGRLELVRKIGTVAHGAGYTGVNIRTDDGSTVGRWLENRGPSLVQADPDGS